MSPTSADSAHSSGSVARSCWYRICARVRTSPAGLSGRRRRKSCKVGTVIDGVCFQFCRYGLAHVQCCPPVLPLRLTAFRSLSLEPSTLFEFHHILGCLSYTTHITGKNVLMYCTGGVRCERASALLKSKFGDAVNGVYQLQVCGQRLCRVAGADVQYCIV
jgi:hypothetical protein